MPETSGQPPGVPPTPTPRAMPLRAHDPGRIGSYEVLGFLGEGGMGVVYLGGGADGRLVAIKVVRGEYARDTEFRARGSGNEPTGLVQFRIVRDGGYPTRLDGKWTSGLTGPLTSNWDATKIDNTVPAGIQSQLNNSGIFPAPG